MRAGWNGTVGRGYATGAIVGASAVGVTGLLFLLIVGFLVLGFHFIPTFLAVVVAGAGVLAVCVVPVCAIAGHLGHEARKRASASSPATA